MKRINLAVILFVCPMILFGQLKVQSNGEIIIGSTLGTNANVPVVFKVNNNFVGTTGSPSGSNVSFGYGSLLSPTGGENTAIGYNVLYSNTTGRSNTATGMEALYYNTEGHSNTATGYWALYYNRTGNYNTATGISALYMNETGSSNTANGFNALRKKESGNYNTAMGALALRENKYGSYNTAIGYSALYDNYSGSYNTAVGSFADIDHGLTNATAIGYNAFATQNDQVRLGNTSVTSIVGGANWTGLSDGRAKKNIRTEVPGLAFINLLQPITYNFDLDALDELQKSDDPKIISIKDSLRMAASPEEKEIRAKARANKEKIVYSGFIAQDVEKAAQSVGYDFSGVDAPEKDKGAYGLRYAEFVVPLVKAVQELSEQNNRLLEQNNRMQEQINELIAKMNESPKQPASGIIDDSSSAKNFSFTIFPNPTNGLVTVDYTLYADASVSIELFNNFGQRVKLIAPKQNKNAGMYSVQTSVVDLGTGTYIVKVTSDSQIESKQLVVNN